MAGRLNSAFLKLPYFLQDALVTGYDLKSYRLRHGGVYGRIRQYLLSTDGWGLAALRAEQSRRLSAFLGFASVRSRWYSKYRSRELADYPVLTKDDLVRNLAEITTTTATDRVASYTGGTTGASLKVYYTAEDVQERNAFLDHFRGKYGYRLGRRTAWFSGKNIATTQDVANGRCYRDDMAHHIRYFSTFHISDSSFFSYWTHLCQFEPEFVVGFPSSVYQICRSAMDRGLALRRPVEVYFPVAETVLPEYRAVIGKVFGCEVRDQYASSEGAPFIFECPAGKMHMHPLSGIFEVVDHNLRPADEGELLVTAFATRGTPLIRYRIGDRVRLGAAGDLCECGSWNPIVERIDGRTSDYVWSPEFGRINLGNLSNSTKGIKGLKRFQVRQDMPEEITVKIAATEAFDHVQLDAFIHALRERTGDDLKIVHEVVDEIPPERSGKYRIVINTLPKAHY